MTETPTYCDVQHVPHTSTNRRTVGNHIQKVKHYLINSGGYTTCIVVEISDTEDALSYDNSAARS